jgi:Chaperone for flagella basal body P-ring formation
MRATGAMLLAGFLQVLPGGGAVHGGGRVALEQAVIARGAIVTVSDLLPADAPAQLRARATSVVVGDAPLPGASRTFHVADVEYALRDAPEVRAAVAVPPEIAVTRWSRLLSRQEIFAALSRAVAGGELPEARSLAPADLGAIPAVLVTEDLPQIEITRSEPGARSAETRIRMWIPAEPRVPPFWIDLHGVFTVSPGATGGASPVATTAARVTARRAAQAAADEPAARSDSGVLIRSGQRVELVMLATGMRISAQATALERGRQGQKIRVRSSLAGKILIATVVNAQMVEVSF